MNLHYLFSRNQKIGSRLISWGSSLFKEHITNLEPDKVPSHVAVLIDETYVIESTMTTGVRVIPYNKWQEKNEELYKIPCIQNKRLLVEKTKMVLFEVWGKKYDYVGIIYFTYCMIKHLVFKSCLPDKNKFERENYYFCTEFAARIGNYNYSMTTPAKMCNDFLEGIKK
jgi:hypothetical protein